MQKEMRIGNERWELKWNKWSIKIIAQNHWGNMAEETQADHFINT